MKLAIPVVYNGNIIQFFESNLKYLPPFFKIYCNVFLHTNHVSVSCAHEEIILEIEQRSYHNSM